MPLAIQTQVKTGDMFWCDPDPKDTVGSEQEKDRVWVVVSEDYLHRGKCVVCVPLTTKLDKACGHLVQILAADLKMLPGTTAVTCVALTDQIRALDKTRFRKKAGTITSTGLHAIRFGMSRLFNL